VLRKAALMLFYGRKIESTKAGWPSVTWRSKQISYNFVIWFMFYRTRTVQAWSCQKPVFSYEIKQAEAGLVC
jgi:hypothetical protein